MKLHLLLSAVLQLAVSEFVGFVANDGEIYVDGKTTDSDGTSDKPYKFIAGALDGKSEAVTIVMVDGTHAAEESAVTLAYAHTISGDAANKVTKSVKAIENGVFKATLATGTVKFEKMTFQLVSYKIQTGKTAAEGDQATPLSSNVFVLSDAGTLALDTVDFKMYDLTTAQQAYAEVDAITAEIIKAEAGSVALTSVTFTGTNMGTGKSLIDTSTAGVKLTLTDTTFTSITMNNQPLLSVNAAATSGIVFAASDATGSVNTFTGIKRSNAGGAVLEVTLTGNTDKLDLTNAVFSTCGSDADVVAGAVKITLSAAAGTLTITKDQFTATDNTFTKKTCAVIFAAASTDLLFNAPTDTTAGYALATTLTDLATADHKYYATVGSHTAELKSFNAAPTDSPVYVVKGGYTGDTCGHQDLPCGTVTKALTHVDGSTITTIEIVKGSSDADLEEIQLASVTKTVTVQGQEKESNAYPIAVSLTDDAFVMAANGALTVKKLGITLDSSGLGAKLLTMEAGTSAELSDMTVTGTASDERTVSLITATAGSLTISGCVFKDITLSSGNGGVLAMTVAASQTLSITDTEFDTCKVTGSSANGGALAITVGADSGTVTLGGASANSKKVTFKGCTATGNGGAVYISTAKAVTLDDMEFGSGDDANSATGQGHNIYYVSTHANADITEANLLALEETLHVEDWAATKAFVYQANSGSDVDLFTAATYPARLVTVTTEEGEDDVTTTTVYKTLGEAVSVVVGATDAEETTYTRTITIGRNLAEADINNSPLGSVPAVTKDLSINVAETGIKITLTASLAGAMMTVGAADLDASCTLTVVGLTVELTASATIPHEVFKIVAKSGDATVTGTLDLQGVTIKSSTAGTAATSSVTVIDAAAGVLKMTACAFADITMTDKPLLTVGTDLGDLVMLKKDNDKNTFTSIKRTTAAEIVSDVETTGAVFDVLLPTGGVLAITNADFKACSFVIPDGADADAEYLGGAISIYIADSVADAVIYADALSFADTVSSRSNDAAILGKYVYVSYPTEWKANEHYFSGFAATITEGAHYYVERTQTPTVLSTIPADTNKVSLTLTTHGGSIVTTHASLSAAVNAANGATAAETRVIALLKDAAVAAESAGVGITTAVTIDGTAAGSTNFKKVIDGTGIFTVTSANATITKMAFDLESEDTSSGVTSRANAALDEHAFELKTDGSITFDTVNFAYATAGDGNENVAVTKAVIKAGAGALVLKTVGFTGISVGSGESLIDASAATLSLSACTFSDITLEDSPLLAVEAAGFSILEKDSDNNAVAATVFNKITRTKGTDAGSPAAPATGGSVIELTLSSGTFALHHAKFCQCKVGPTYKDFGGCVYIDVSGSGVVDASGLTFTTADKEGTDIVSPDVATNYQPYVYVKTSGGYEATHGRELKGLIDSTDNTATNYVWVEDADDDEKHGNIGDLPEIYYVGVTAADNEKCTEAAPCTSLAAAYNKADGSSYTAAKKMVKVKAEAVALSDAVVVAKDITVEGADADNSKLTIAAEPAQDASLIKVDASSVAVSVAISTLTITISVASAAAGSTGNIFKLEGSNTPALTLTSVTVKTGVAADAACHLANSLIDASAGTLTLSGCTFSGITLASSPLLAVSTLTMTPAGSNPEVDPCLFADITSGANAAILVLTDPTITIQNAIFMACTGNKAGVAYVSGLTTDSVTWTKPLLFTGCDATTKTAGAEYAANVYVTLADGMSQAAAGAFNTGSKFSVLKDLSSTQGGDFKFSKAGASADAEKNLEMFTWAAEDNTYYVSGTGLDTAAGTRAAPLLTISKALTTASTTASTIKLLGGMHGAETAAVTLSIAHTITGLGETADDVMQAVSAVTNGVFVVSNAEGTVTISKITFILDAGLTSNVFVKSAAGTLALTTVSFEVDGTTALTAEVIKASEGTVAMTSVAFTGTDMGTGKSLIDASDAKLTLATCTFTSITLADKPLLAIAADKFSIDTTGAATVFDQITRTAGTNNTAGGSVLEVAVPDTKTLSLKNAEFYKCEVGDTYKPYGMALYISFWGTGAVDASGLTFSSDAHQSNAITAPFVYVVCETDAYANAHGRELKGLIGTGDETEADIYVWKGTSDAADINGLDEIYYVAASGSSTATCLSETTACDSIATANTKAADSTYPTAKKIIKLGTATSAAPHPAEGSSAVTIAAAITVSGPTSEATGTYKNVEAIEGGVFKVTSTAAVTFEKMTFQLVSYKIQTGKTAAEGDQATPLSSNVFVLSAAGTLALNTVAFVMADLTTAQQAYAEVDAITAEIIKAEAGSVTLTSVTFTGIAMGKDSNNEDAAIPLLGVSGTGSYSFTDAVLFDGVTTTGTGASVYSFTLGTTALDLSKITVKDCGSADTVTDALGYGIKITVSVEDAETPGTLTLPTMQNTQTGSAFIKQQAPLLIEVKQAKLAALTSVASEFASWADAKEHEIYMKLMPDEGNTPLYEGPASHVYLTPNAKTASTATLKVGPTGLDVAGCGWEDLPCKTVSAAYAHKGEATTTISVATGTNALTASNAILELTTTISIEGTLNNGELSTTFGVQGLETETRDACIKITPQASAITTTFNNLIVTITSKTDDSNALTVPVFKIDTVDTGKTAPTLALENVKVTGETTLVTALTASVVDATEGTLTLTGCTFTGITLDDSPLLTVSTATGKFSITATTTFSKITRTSGNGAVFEATVDKDGALAIAKATFTKCGTLNGNGGALAVTVKGGSFKLGTASFKGCFAATETTQTNDDTTTGQGGAMYVSVAENAKNANVDMSAVSVFGATASNNGGGVYVEVKDNTDGVSLKMKDVTVSESKSSQSGGGVFLQVAKDSKDVALSMDKVSVSKSASASGKGNGVYMEVKSESAKLNLTSVKVSQESDVAKDSSSIFVAVPESIANDANVWADLVDSNPDSADSFAVATVDENGNISTETKSIKTIVEDSRKEDDDGFPAWAIVLIVIGSILIVAAVVIIIVCCFCRKSDDSSDSKSREMDRV